MTECEKCKKISKIHLHHIIPKFMGGEDKDGRVNLCEKHHHILHLIIPTFIWKYVSPLDREKCKKDIINFTNFFVKQQEKEDNIFSSKTLKFSLERGFLLDKWTIHYLEKRDIETATKLFDFSLKESHHPRFITKEIVDKFEREKDGNTNTIAE